MAQLGSFQTRTFQVTSSKSTPEMEEDKDLIVKCISTMFVRNSFKSKRTQIVPKMVKNYTCYESFKTHRFVVLQARRWFDGIGLVLTGNYEPAHKGCQIHCDAHLISLHWFVKCHLLVYEEGSVEGSIGTTSLQHHESELF